MSGRGTWLYLRGHHAPLALAALACVGALGRLWWQVVPNDREALLVLYAPGLAAVVLVATLAGAEPALERTAPQPAASWRLAHAALGVLATLVVLGTASVGALDGPERLVILRDVAGLAGAGLLCAACFGARLGWALPSILAMAGVLAPSADRRLLELLAWSGQPGRTSATLIALGLAVVGAAAYGLRGAST